MKRPALRLQSSAISKVEKSTSMAQYDSSLSNIVNFAIQERLRFIKSQLDRIQEGWEIEIFNYGYKQVSSSTVRNRVVSLPSFSLCSCHNHSSEFFVGNHRNICRSWLHSWPTNWRLSVPVRRIPDAVSSAWLHVIGCGRPLLLSDREHRR